VTLRRHRLNASHSNDSTARRREHSGSRPHDKRARDQFIAYPVGDSIVIRDATGANSAAPRVVRPRHLAGSRGALDVYHQAIDGTGNPSGRPQRLTTGLNAQGISLSRDGTRLAYTVLNYRSNIFAASIASDSTPATAIRAVTDENQTIETVDVSADGRWLVFSRPPRKRPAAWWSCGQRRSRSRSYARVFPAHRFRRRSLVLFGSRGGRHSKLVLRLDDTARRTARVIFSADAHRPYFTLTQAESDTWVVTLHG